MMKLYHSPTSPYVRKVMIVLTETGQLDKVEMVPTVPTPLAAPDHLVDRNPLAKVPALEREAGPALFDSRVICAYLNDLAGASLYGSGAGQWEVRTLEALGDGITDAALLMTYEARLRPEAQRWDDWVEGQWAKILRACTALERQWLSHLAGPLDAGQIAVACALAYVDFRHGHRDWRGSAPGLAGWFEGFAARPSMAETRPPGGA